jgi:hypothetical protein
MIFFPTAATSGAVISLLSYIMIFALLPIIIESFFQMMTLVAKGNFLVIKKYILKYVLESKIITIPLLYHNYFTP